MRIADSPASPMGSLLRSAPSYRLARISGWSLSLILRHRLVCVIDWSAPPIGPIDLLRLLIRVADWFTSWPIDPLRRLSRVADWSTLPMGPHNRFVLFVDWPEPPFGPRQSLVDPIDLHRRLAPFVDSSASSIGPLTSWPIDPRRSWSTCSPISPLRRLVNFLAD